MNKFQEQFQFGAHEMTLETGRMARQATAAVLATMGETQVLATVVVKPNGGEYRDFFPLTVNYQERTYAAGKIPGGYFKREGRPTEAETLTSRLIDRPIRPLFPKGYVDEVQVIATVLSLDPEVNPDIPAMVASSAALTIAGIPFQGPIAAARVGYVNGEYVLNPDNRALEGSDLDLVVAGTKDAVLMVESEANQLPEDVMLEAVMYGHEHMQVAIDAILSLRDKVGGAESDWVKPEENSSLREKIDALVGEKINAAYTKTDKVERYAALDALLAEAVSHFVSEDSEAAVSEHDVIEIVSGLKKEHVRQNILDGKPRIDGRDCETVRPINVESSVLKRAHGSALFTRGETQALAVVALGGGRDAQLIDSLHGDLKQHFMLHYNFQPFCVGEVGFLSSPKRREIGHGKLAWRALNAVVPNQEEFPYVIRVVSETLESNGSSSMAAVCGGCMSLMDAGVPIKAPVAGVAMGLIKSGDKFAVLTDILGDEDHLGDMDFKVAGSRNGITALQMDIKITGITREIMQQALKQANAGRMHILDIMEKELGGHREQLSAHAPRIMSFKIKADKIRDVIGKGGATIRSLTEETGTSIDLTDDGTVTICAPDQASGDDAKARIEALVAEPEVGAVYEGKVNKIMEFGAFVNIMPGKDGLVHVSQIANERVNDVNDFLSEGQTVKVKVLEIDRTGRIRLSMKALLNDQS